MGDEHDNFQDFDMCPDCKGKGHYPTFLWDDDCPRCEGAGWVEKGTGWSRMDAAWHKTIEETNKKGPIE